jgi:hypothetical protein
MTTNTTSHSQISNSVLATSNDVLDALQNKRSIDAMNALCLSFVAWCRLFAESNDTDFNWVFDGTVAHLHKMKTVSLPMGAIGDANIAKHDPNKDMEDFQAWLEATPLPPGFDLSNALAEFRQERNK